MSHIVSICVIGDLDKNNPTRQATDDALHHAANHLSIKLNIAWLATQSLLASEEQQRLSQFTGLWASAGVYQSQEGAIRGIQFARELDCPFIGT